MGSGHLPSDFRLQVGEIGAGHFASIVLASDTFGHSLAFYGNRLKRGPVFAAQSAFLRNPIMVIRFIFPKRHSHSGH
jgi:hypothetical protein